MHGIFRWSSKWWPGLIPLVAFWIIAAWTNTALVETDLSHAKEVAERVRSAIDGLSLEVKGKPMRFTISIGIAALHGSDVDDAIDRADHEIGRAHV